MIDASLLRVGCDPELFFKHDGKFLSAYGLVQGDKLNPTPLMKGAVQVDGMALEFNIEPAKNAAEFVENISTVLQQIRNSVSPDIEFDYSSTVHLTQEYLSSRCYEEIELGCEPDFNVYTGEPNVKPDVDKPMRTAGGHVHIGFAEDLPDTEMVHDIRTKLVRLCDVYLGVPSVLLDKDVERRTMYGKAGAYRKKHYGVEYRSLSNFWIRDADLSKWVYDQVELLFSQLGNFDKLSEQLPDVERIINESDKDAARALVQQLDIKLPY